MVRWLGIDHGTKRIGIAAGSGRDGIASPLAVISARPADQAIADIRKLASQYQAAGIVVGWPLNMDDSEGPQGKLARQLARRLAAATKLDVRLWDERLSSFAADRILAGTSTRKKKKARQDAVAAATMLQDFLAVGGPESAPRPDEIDPQP
ncbi:MAG: Holliday junction resolvase RuvX [Planctomycetota bacterium]|nr:Holliday junction resolvase RuvX [Planctomycetota bacterium]